MRTVASRVKGLMLVLLAAALLLAGAGAARPSAAAQGTPAGPGWARPTDPVAHDPTMGEEGGYFYVIITGDAQNPGHYLPIKRSRDLIHWQEVGPVFTSLPAWVTRQLGTTPADAWGPDLIWADGLWRLYYAASQFGTQNSVIGLATSPTLDPQSPHYAWTDRGMVLRSTPGVDDFNAIDPAYVDDGHGGAWLAFGSFWGGITMRRLDAATGMLAAGDTTEYPLASRVAPDAEEGPAIVRHGGYFYLFLSFDYCCRGIQSDYRMVVGRATSVTGPYLDQSGVPLLAGGGGEVMRGYHEFIGTGGGDLYVDGRDTYLVNHYYDATDNGTPRLNVRRVSWHSGWPVVGDPLNPSRTVGHGDAYVQLIERTTGLPVVDAGCGYEGADLALGPDVPSDRCGQWQYGYRGEGTSSLLGRFSNKVGEIHACENYDGGPVAQWGWLGFLPNNDCQRWRAVPASDGWSMIQSVLTGSRVLDVSDCMGGTTQDIVVDTVGGSPCQQFRFAPVGPVLLIDQRHASSVLDGPACPAYGVVQNPLLRDPCRQWRFTSIGGAEYTLTDTLTARRLGTQTCPRPGADTQPQLLGPADDGCDQQTDWTLVPNTDGTWTLALTGTPITETVTLDNP